MNVFRFTGDMLHVFGILAILRFVIRHPTLSASKVAIHSQILFLMVCLCRYFDIMTNFVSVYNTFMKLFYITVSCITVIWWMIPRNDPSLELGKEEEANGATPRSKLQELKSDQFKDKNLKWGTLILIGLTLILALEFNYDGRSAMEILWTFSIYLESVAILPQFVLYLKGDGNNRSRYILLYYLVPMGLYRGFYILNWIYRYEVQRFYDPISIAGGIAQTLFYAAFAIILGIQSRESQRDQEPLKLGRIHHI